MKTNGSLPRLLTHAEYAANMSGLNIFFGAMIGVVMADAEGMTGLRYAVLLAFVAGYVVTLLYVSASRHRLAYALIAAAPLALGWYFASKTPERLPVDAVWMTDRLLPALSVWLLMIVAVEFAPRSSADNGA